LREVERGEREAGWSERKGEGEAVLER